MTSLRFLELVEGEDNRTTEELRRLVHAQGTRKQALAELFYERYYPVLAQVGALAACTHSQLAQAFTHLYNLQGSTLRKALSFFTHLAREGEIPLSEFIRTARNPGSKQRAQQSKSTTGSFLARFRNGGYALLICTGDPFRLEPGERSFLFSLVDLFRDYEQEGSASDEKDARAQEVTHAQ